jgi:cytochrome c oxidase assembly protein subunit 11
VTKKSHKRIIITLLGVTIGMFAFGFALVPIYNSLCNALGINGKVTQAVATNSARPSQVNKERMVTVEFVATINSALPWAFYPKTAKIKVHPGEISKLAFYAENKTDHRMTVQAIPSITPAVAAKYLKKTECFCFTQQTLNGHEAMDLPLLFHLDTDLPENIKTITLAYTLFDVSDKITN